MTMEEAKLLRLRKEALNSQGQNKIESPRLLNKTEAWDHGPLGFDYMNVRTLHSYADIHLSIH
jgi:hypothetical protein